MIQPIARCNQRPRPGAVLAALLALILLQVPLSAAEDADDIDCVITPSVVVEVSTAVSGVLDTVSVERSDRVTKGELIASLDSRVEATELRLAKARANMDAVIRLRKTSLAYDRRSWRRVSTLRADNLVSDEAKDDAEREAQLSRWRLQDANDLLAQREIEVERAQELLRRRQVYSPINGLVVQRLRHPGEYVEEQPIVKIAQLDPLYVEAVVPMSVFGRIKPGMQADVLPEIGGDQPLPAEVVVVDGLGDAASGTFGVRLALPNGVYATPAGIKCRVRFVDADFGNDEAEQPGDGFLERNKLSGLVPRDQR